jgi:hypothetical protein
MVVPFAIGLWHVASVNLQPSGGKKISFRQQKIPALQQAIQNHLHRIGREQLVQRE